MEHTLLQQRMMADLGGHPGAHMPEAEGQPTEEELEAQEAANQEDIRAQQGDMRAQEDYQQMLGPGVSRKKNGCWDPAGDKEGA